LEKNKNINFTHWFFDLDNTLYCANSGIFDQIHKKMSEFISTNLNVSLEKAKLLQKKYFVENGTTLYGLMLNHNINPEKFLDYVHDIDFSIVKPDNELNDLIKKIPEKKIIFTNANISYVKKILKNLNLENIFDDIYDIEKMDYLPKPNLKTYKKLISTYNFDVKKAILFDDIPQNLLPAADLGLKTVQVYNKKLDKELNGRSKKIDYMTNNLKEWLQKWIQNN
jgi:putative hydrolase of the HAD superfamily